MNFFHSDGENKITSAWGGNNQAQLYGYDAGGQRIKRTVDGTETWQVYGLGGELLVEYPVNGDPDSPQKEYGYRNGQLLITAEPGTGQQSTENVSWTNVVGVAVNGNSLTKRATGDVWGNAGASSTQSLSSGDGYVEFTASETSSYRMIGLSQGDANQGYQELDFAFYLGVSGYLYIYENNVPVYFAGFYTTGDTLRVAVESGVVKYRQNGTLLYTSGATPNYPLLVDTSFYTAASTVSNVIISGNLGGGGGSSNGVQWLVADHLGTPRMIIGEMGTLADVKRHDYLPFGEELFAGAGGRTTGLGYASGDGVRQQFTSKERDSVTGLDYFGARYYASVQGRFTSPDSYAGRLVNPQTLNLYSYVRNNPLKYVDPTGHQDENPKKKGKKGNGDDEFLNTEDTPEVVVINSEPALGPPPDPPTLSSKITRATFQFNDFMLRQTLRFASGGPIIMAAEGLLPKAWIDEWHSPAVQIPLMMSVVGSPLAVEAGAEEVTAAMEGEIDALFEMSAESVVVRGGLTELPPAGEKFSGAVGKTIEDAAAFVSHGTIRSTTVGAIESNGGSVVLKPELTRSGVLNPRHVNITEGSHGPSTFSEPFKNPVPRKSRIH